MIIKRSEDIIFYMLAGPRKDTGVDPIKGKNIKTLGTFTCTYDQAFGKGTIADVMREINIPDGFDFYFRPYNDGRVIGLLRKPENPNTFKYFLGKTTNCQNNDQLFVNEIIEYFERENQKRKMKPFYIKRGRTNWGTINITQHNKNIAIRIINEALNEMALKYGIKEKVSERVKKKIKNGQNNLSASSNAERIIKKDAASKSENEIGGPNLLKEVGTSYKNNDDFKIARKFQEEAEDQARKMNDSKIYGAKCWYGDAVLIENGARRVFIGINPGGGKDSQQIDIDKRCLELPYAKRGYNAWIDDEDWEGKGPQHQERVKQMFQSMYGNAWEEYLRETACFNVVPFRTQNASVLSAFAWNVAKNWFQRVIEHINPALILCNGNGESKSPWSVLCSLYNTNIVNKILLGAKGSTASIKDASIISGPLHGARIIGMPLLNRFGWPETYEKLGTLKPFI